MSFNITLQKNLSEVIKVHKTVNDIATVTGELRDSSTISNPNVLIEGSLSDYIDVNYFTIPSFKRSYFVTEKTSFRNGLVELTGRTDVLSSDIPTLEAQNAIIKKQTNYYNLLLNDGSIHAYQNPHIIMRTFPNQLNTYSYVLIVAGVAYAAGINIVTQPVDFYAEEVGASGRFLVVAEGEGLVYQWQKSPISGFQIWQDISGATGYIYNFTATAEAAEWRYRCRIQNMYGAQAYTNIVQIVLP